MLKHAAAHGVVLIRPHPETPGEFRLTTELWLPQPIETVFSYFCDVRNLEAITPPWLRFRIISDPTAELRAGSLIDYRLRLHGLPIRWRTEITEWSPSRRFIDTQSKGPYRKWRHLHTFEPAIGGTLACDQVDYSMVCGGLANWLLVRRDLYRIFEYRHQVMVSQFGAVRGG